MIPSLCLILNWSLVHVKFSIKKTRLRYIVSTVSVQKKIILHWLCQSLFQVNFIPQKMARNQIWDKCNIFDVWFGRGTDMIYLTLHVSMRVNFFKFFKTKMDY